jgi:RNA polymerase sigma factor for flagellar operon FliA
MRDRPATGRPRAGRASGAGYARGTVRDPAANVAAARLREACPSAAGEQWAAATGATPVGGYDVGPTADAGHCRRDIREDPMVTTRGETDIAQVWTDYRANPTVDLRNRLLEHYLPLVKYNAERIWARLPDGVELDDLMSAGVFGLMDAVDAFDLHRGVKFETYCVPRIRGAMLDELRTMDWVPRLVRSKQSKVEMAKKALEAEFGRPPRPEELAAKLGVPLDQIESFVGEATAANLVSLNKKWYETDSYKDVREIDILEDKKAEDPTGRLQNRDLMRLVTRGLNRNERLIVILYYYEEMTMKEIGATLNLSESRVSQMHSSIVARLQAQLCKRRPEFGN